MQALGCITPRLLILSFFVLLYLVAIIYSIAYGRDVESLQPIRARRRHPNNAGRRRPVQAQRRCQSHAGRGCLAHT